jgi:hypothetical protein
MLRTTDSIPSNRAWAVASLLGESTESRDLSPEVREFPALRDAICASRDDIRCCCTISRREKVDCASGLVA